ncbi:pseudouridine synthase [Dorea sp. AM10-31]|uniref:pseudouridine synthase n=1 Tax=Dorea sp. AM10-31 TaxID=2293098 RepID=UPI000E40B3CB|nr:pseudouridine synthase [Dorea sp. AM10-31]RGF23846.1 rRNA pseudouridine synthase [Dorea sp. AM10-31]
MIRLDKYLADMSIGTRQEVKKYIRQGRVKINEDIIKKPEYKIREDEDKITFDGAPVAYETFEYYMLNKPAGVISATEDKRDITVLNLIKEKKRKDLFPVGRLDKDTEGLLLITNDGALAHRLLSPKKHVDKCYYAKIRGGVTEDDVRVFKERINIGTQEEPEWTMPAELKILEKGTVSRIRLTIREGKFHQVKRMFLAVGKEVVYLKRERMGALVLDEELAPGEYRKLTDSELKSIL